MNELQTLNNNIQNFNQTNEDISILTRDISDDKDFIMLFLNNKAEGSKETARGYAYEVKYFLDFIQYPSTKLREVTAKQCLSYREHLKNHKKEYASATIIKKLNVISSLYKYGIDTGYLRFNPLKAVKKPKAIITSQDKYLTEDETIKLLYVLRKRPINYLMGILFITTGLRVSELSNIQWKHFYEDGLGNIGLRVVGKGAKARVVKVKRDVWSYIIQYRISKGQNIEFNPSDESYLFTTKNGNQLIPRPMRETIKRAGKRAGLKKDISPHWLRHTSASLSINGGCDIKTVMETYGWSQMKTAQRYIHSVNLLEKTATDYINIPI